MMSTSKTEVAQATGAAARAGAAVVDVRSLEKSYGEVQALRGIDFSIPAGSVVGFLGPNGAGKTTAIKILTGSLAADGGSARVCGFDVEADSMQARASIGYLPENNPLYLDMRVESFLRFAWGAQRTAQTTESRADALDRVVQATGLQEVYRRPISACSKGFRQRVGFAQALLSDPPLLILDEPTNGLDPIQVVEIRELVRDLGKRKTVLLTTHILSEVEALAERVVLIHRGQKVADDSLDRLAEDSGHAHVRVVIEGSAAELNTAVQSMGATVLQEQAHRYGATCAAAVIELDSLDGSALAELSRGLQVAGLAVIEFAPLRAGLESLFRSLEVGA